MFCWCIVIYISFRLLGFLGFMKLEKLENSSKTQSKFDNLLMFGLVFDWQEFHHGTIPCPARLLESENYLRFLQWIVNTTKLLQRFVTESTPICLAISNVGYNGVAHLLHRVYGFFLIVVLDCDRDRGRSSWRYYTVSMILCIKPDSSPC